MESKNCLICGVEKPELVYQGFDRLIGIDGTFSIVTCAHCGFVYLNPRPTELEMERYYPKNYYSFHRWTKKKGILKTVYRKFKWKYLSFSKLTRFRGVPRYKKNGKILDFGCGSGEVLSILKSLGWDVYGVEVSEEAVEYARSKGLDVYKEGLKSLHFPRDYFDVIRLSSVLEHVHDASDTLREIHRILKPKGVLLLIVPNIESFSSKLFKSRWYNLDVPRHLYHFSLKSLTELLRKHSFRVISSRSFCNGSFLGSIDYLLNEKKNKFGTRLYRIRFFRWVTFILLESWLNILRKGDLIQVQAQKQSQKE